MRTSWLPLALTASFLVACTASPEGDSLGTDSARQVTDGERRTCLVPVRTPVVGTSPLYMIGATTITRVDVSWWHGVPQFSSDPAPTFTFALDRSYEDANDVHYEAHEVGPTDPARSLRIDVERSPSVVEHHIGTARLSSPAGADEVTELRRSAPCDEL
jgi:hypothetical protein